MQIPKYNNIVYSLFSYLTAHKVLLTMYIENVLVEHTILPNKLGSKQGLAMYM